MQLSGLDWVLLVVLAAGAWRGYRRGLVASLAGLLATALGLWLGLMATQVASAVAQQLLPSLAAALGRPGQVVLGTVLVVFLVRLAGQAISAALHHAGLGTANRAFGAVLGLLLGLLWCYLGLSLVAWVGPAAGAQAVAGSTVARAVLVLGQAIFSFLFMAWPGLRPQLNQLPTV